MPDAVYAKEQYSAEEWARIWRDAGGHVCGLLSDVPVSASAPCSRRAVLAGALLIAISPLMAQTGRVRIRIADPAGAVIAGADVTLLGPEDKPLETVRVDAKGEAVFSGLPIGDCLFLISAMGFRSRSLIVTLWRGDDVDIESRLELGPFIVGTIVEAESSVGHAARPMARHATPGNKARVSIRIRDTAGHVILGGKASVSAAEAKPTKPVLADGSGEILLADLPQGECRITLAAVGFQNRQFILTLRNSDDVQIETTLMVG